MKNDTNIQYPNAPLKQVLFEMRFDGNLVVESKKYEYQKEVFQRYPLLSIPNSVDGQPYDMMPYKFTQLDETEGVMLSIVNFIYFQRKYQSYNIFKNQWLKELSLFESLFPDITQLNRIGLRYINIINLQKTIFPIPITNYLRLDLKNKLFDSNSLTSLSNKWGYKYQQYDVTINVDTNTAPQSIILDIDFSNNEKSNIFDLDVFVETAHAEIKRIFETLITVKYRKFMKGEIYE